MVGDVKTEFIICYTCNIFITITKVKEYLKKT